MGTFVRYERKNWGFEEWNPLACKIESDINKFVLEIYALISIWNYYTANGHVTVAYTVSIDSFIGYLHLLITNLIKGNANIRFYFNTVHNVVRHWTIQLHNDNNLIIHDQLFVIISKILTEKMQMKDKNNFLCYIECTIENVVKWKKKIKQIENRDREVTRSSRIRIHVDDVSSAPPGLRDHRVYAVFIHLTKRWYEISIVVCA